MEELAFGLFNSIILKYMLLLLCRKHFLQVPHGLLNKHFEKLIQCDTRLNFLSRQPETTLDCPYFESQPCAADNLNESNNYEQDRRESTRQATFSIFEDVATPSALQSSSITIKQEDAGAAEAMSREAPSPSSGTVLSSCLRLCDSIPTYAIFYFSLR